MAEKTMRILAGLLLMALLAGCVQGSGMTTGNQMRPPIHVSKVKVYTDPPAEFEELGLVEARSQVGSTAEAVSAPRPNLVIVLTDDAGFSDLGCYGGEIETPRIDELAANGLRFARFYTNARCSPTRASLMTGC